jgi:hypothetical protein
MLSKWCSFRPKNKLVAPLVFYGLIKIIDVSGLPFGERGAAKINRDLGPTERPSYLPWMNFGGPHH